MQISLGEAVAKYLAGLPSSKRGDFSEKLTHFISWFSWEYPIDKITPATLEDYAQKFPQPENLEIVKDFLKYAKKEKFTRLNLAIYIRIKKPSNKKAATTKPTPPITLTPEGYQQLERELKDLKAERERLIKAISQAREDKDFAENAPLQVARERLGYIEPRIQEIEEVLKTAELFKKGKQVIDIGSRVKLRELRSGEVVNYQLVHGQEVNPSQGKISIASPLGKALLGKGVGEQIEVKAPAGTYYYQIEEIK